MATFLASSYNVELVYIILKGITQFGHLYSNAAGKCVLTDKKISKISHLCKDGDSTITLKEIKIKNSHDWQQQNECELIKQTKDTDIADLVTEQQIRTTLVM